MTKSIKESKRLSIRFDEAKENFDIKCQEVIQRCIEEEKHAQAVEQNAGKELDWFKAPTLFTRERFGVRARSSKGPRAKRELEGSQSQKLIKNAQPVDTASVKRWQF